MAMHFGLEGRLHLRRDALQPLIDAADRERIAAAVAHALRHGAGLDVEFRAAAPDASGAPRWLRAVGWCDVDEHGTPLRFDGVTLDVGKHKLAEQELHRLAQELGEKNRMQSEFLFTLAHELRNPLAPIRSGLELMRSDVPVTGGRDIPGMMQRQVDHMVHLVDDLLDMARLTQGKLTIRPERVMLDALVRDAVEMSTPLISAGAHRLDVALPQQPVALQVDPHRIAQVLSNLLNNAAKYTPPGGAIGLDAWIDGGDIVVAVRDNGVGIAADQLTSVFELYTQVAGSDGMAQGGLGVGLNLVQRLVQLHGGTVRAASGGPGLGSEFTVSLPLADDAVDTAFEPSAALAVAPSALKILVVDDNIDAAETLCALLEFSGHEVRAAHTGATAVEQAQRFTPQMVFLDIGLPDLDGFQVAQRLRSIAGMAEATIVALTGWGTERDIERTRQAGFNHHLTKPVDFNTVQALLAEKVARAA